MAFKMKGNPIQRNFFQRVLGLGKKSKRPRTTTGGAGGFVSAIGQAPAATQGAGSFVSALGMKTPAKHKIRSIGPHNPAHDTVGDFSDAAHNNEEFKKLDPPKPKPKNPFEQETSPAKNKPDYREEFAKKQAKGMRKAVKGVVRAFGTRNLKKKKLTIPEAKSTKHR